ncbi:MAG TPA: condensation domain-containing protein [Solirubrobacteraceae bacterium]|jgi:NRPS condensation-like uncharacterized protein|nr:condensation domain-containing protein [Solirubrobacteraceae bacterium]
MERNDHPTSVDLNVLDELYLHLDRDDEPWSVHLEVGVEGTIDSERLAEAIRAGVSAHPIARARLRPSRATDVRYHWEIAEELGEVPLTVTACPDSAALAAARERLMSGSPSLDASPPFAVTHAHHPAGDTIMLNLSHAAGDGMSAVRLMASFLRSYAGQPDPPAPVNSLAVRNIGRLVNSGSFRARLARGRTLIERSARLAGAPARVAPQGAEDRPGYGFSLLHLDADELRAVIGHRHGGATVNDVLLAALAVTVAGWNDRHGTRASHISLMMPVNLRPAEWRTEVVGNFASYVSVAVDPADHLNLATAVAAAADRTRQIKRQRAAGLVVDLLEVPTATLPTAVKKRFQDLITLTGSRLVDTAVLSNLGRLDSAPYLGPEAGSVRQVWFSPPGRMPLGASLGGATYENELFLCLRYRHALLDATGAAAFTGLLHETLTTG